MVNSTTCLDDSFGPTVHGCRGDFDFTLLFEQSFLSVAPSSLLILLAVARIWSLRSRKREVGGTAFQLGKIAAIACYGAVQIAILVLWSKEAERKTTTSLAAAALSFVDTPFLAATSWCEHAYSPRPSALLNVYLLLSVLFDAVQTRTIWLMEFSSKIAALLTVTLAIKVCLLLLESIEKGRFLPPEWQDRSPEEKGGIFSQSLLLWLRRILLEGRKRIISMKDLYALDDGLRTTRWAEAFWERWTVGSATATPISAATVLFRTLKWPFLAPVLPRLAQMAFTICQPLLLRRFLDYLQGDETVAAEATGYGFIGAYGLVYLGMAISTCFYWRLMYRTLVQMRGCLVAAIYKKTTLVDTARYDMAAPVALMSTDIERIIQGMKDLHEIWANAVQVAVSIWLLYEELGVACVAPAVVAAICCVGSLGMSSRAHEYQVTWMAATQKRVEATASAIASMKGIKFLGLTEKIYDMIKKLRAAELRSARRFRYLEVLTATISFAPLLLSPLFTFLVFVLQARSSGEILDMSKIFTTISLLQLTTQPLVWLFQAIPLFIASVGCLGRIGEYLLAQPRTDKRDFGWSENSNSTSESSSMTHNGVTEEKAGLRDPEKRAPRGIAVRDGEFGWIDKKPTLKNVNIDIPASKLTMVVGPVACGKTTLGRAIIGELPYSKGQIHLGSSHSEIAYCDQDPFLTNASLQHNILSFSIYDSKWYNSVLHAVGLGDDITTLPEGDRTNLGSKGIALSGGQRQRVSIARAVYAKTSMAVFDDVLSGLDAVTKDHVFKGVFGPGGLLQQNACTVVFCTHDVDLLPKADHIIALGTDGQIVESGSFVKLARSPGYIGSLSVRKKQKSSVDGRIHETVGVPSDLAFKDDNQAEVKASEDKSRRLGDTAIYKYFFRRIGLWRLLVFAFYQSGWAVFSTIGPVWLKFWSAANATGSGHDGFYLGIYAVFQTLGLVFLALFAGHTLTTVAVKAGTKLHGVTLKTVMQAPMSFFSTVDTGITTNRFSQDILLIDGDLPMALLETVSAGLVAFVQLILIAVASPYVAIAYPFVIGILYLVQKFYLRTSRQLRFLDLEAKSPLYTHFLETLHGLATIRAFGWSDGNNVINHGLLDASQRPLYLLYMVQRWLQLVLDILTMAMAVILIAVAVKLEPTSTGFIGVALINLMSINHELKMIVINWTSLETSLSAIARTKSFEENTPGEHQPAESNHPPKEWPQAGNIQLNSVSGSYRSV